MINNIMYSLIIFILLAYGIYFIMGWIEDLVKGNELHWVENAIVALDLSLVIVLILNF